MPEQQTTKVEQPDATGVRPTKKQRELLTFIEQFIAAHGYSPSYREIMNGLQYTSVATVALHVNNLIRRGHLRKRDRSARSLEVVQLHGNAAEPGTPPKVATNAVRPTEEKWLVEKVEQQFADAERALDVPAEWFDQLHILVGALRVLGLEGAAQSFVPRLGELKVRMQQAQNRPTA